MFLAPSLLGLSTPPPRPTHPGVKQTKTLNIENEFKVATTRMVDHIPMAIYYHLVKQLLEGMATEIIKITTEENSHRNLLIEDSSTVFTRKRLLEKQERLEKATVKLLKFGSSTYTHNRFYSNDSFCFDDID